MAFIYETKCSKCGWISPGPLYGKEFRKFKYLMASGREINIPWEYGWCNECGGIRPIEIFGKAPWLNVLKEISIQLNSVEFTGRGIEVGTGKEISVELERINGIPNFGGLERIEINEDVLLGWRNEILDVIEALEYVDTRQTPSECLTCGGTSIQTGMFHPGCGGEFVREVVGHIFRRDAD
jgi:hypothetical protein